jgi:hypothetical protein
MSLASDLMGLGVSPLQAARTASAGIGPIAATATGTTASTGYTIKGSQYITYFTTGASTYCTVLPTPGGDTGPLVGDDFVIHNNSATALSVFTPTNVTLNVIGVQITNTSAISVSQYHTLTIWVYSSTQYFGLYA